MYDCSLFNVSRSTGPFLDRLVSLAASQGSLAHSNPDEKCFFVMKKSIGVEVVEGDLSVVCWTDCHCGSGSQPNPLLVDCHCDREVRASWAWQSGDGQVQGQQ